MEEFKGTLGPWFVVSYGGINGSGYFIGSDNHPDGCNRVTGMEPTLKKEDAVLIAAAPELEEAFECEFVTIPDDIDSAQDFRKWIMEMKFE